MECIKNRSINNQELDEKIKVIYSYFMSTLDKALAAVFGDLFKSSHFSRILKVYRMILDYPQAVAPLRDVVSNLPFSLRFLVSCENMLTIF